MANKHRLYSPELAETILERLADGENLNAICREEGMPSDGAVRHWALTDHDGFATRYAHAREVGCQKMADDILEIADTAKDGDTATAARVRCDNRRWLLSKMLPKQFGDRLDLNHSGEVAIRDLPDEGLSARLEQLLKQAQGVG